MSAESRIEEVRVRAYKEGKISRTEMAEQIAEDMGRAFGHCPVLTQAIDKLCVEGNGVSSDDDVHNKMADIILESWGLSKFEPPKLVTVEARYQDLLNLLDVNGHDGAVAEIKSLRARCGLE